VTTQIEVLSAIRDIVDQFDTAAIYITHDLAVVSQMADRIQVLRWGKLIEEGDTRQIVQDPQKDYTRDLLAVRTFRKPPVNEPKPDIPLLKMDNVTAAYGNKMTVLFDVTMEIHKKRTVAVVGESGSGKSTAARVITGLLPPSQGEISYEGLVLPRDFRQRNKGELRRLQMIYQSADTALNPKQRVRDVIGRPLEFYLAIHGSEKEKRVLELLDMIELPADFADRLPSELSGGQKQRICIARALAAEPELIICDEVTSALDQLVAEEILKLLQRLQNELELAYMFITHDLATVKAIADEIVVMLQGRVVEQGEKQDILTPPHHEYTELLLSSVPEMDPDWLTGVLAAREAAAQ
jgi:peptide/nickel transport system ATP-binding protein